MASSFLTFVTKWLCVPAGMVAVGYFGLGPQIGNNAAFQARVEPVKEIIGDAAEVLPREQEPAKPKGKFDSVKVKVDVTEDDRKKPDSNSEVQKRPDYFTPEAAGDTYEEIPELPDTPESTTPDPTSEPIPDTGGW
ncbi:hypothetical protein CCB80_14150 [Armatimonadetes bacterium Uphvl-Ar1]|nr:hypothetical protein CCB80_14150 [Armatimonadetes bacterium Uphvl-Ar1]